MESSWDSLPFWVLLLSFTSPMEASFRAEAPLPSRGGPLAAGDEGEDREEDEKEEEDEPEDSPLTEREKRILELFQATSENFENGRLVLNYDFETREETLVEDWLEGLDTSLRSRIHWATSAELKHLVDETTRAYLAQGAIVLSDSGRWTHRGVFLPDVEMEVTLVSVAPPRPGTVYGPAFHSAKRKLTVCANQGWQAVLLKGTKPSSVHPKGEKPLAIRAMHTLSYKYNGKVFECSKARKKTNDTSEAPKITEGIEVGHAAMAWNGSVKCFLVSATIEGRLDPDWVAEKLGEKGGKGKETKGAGGKKK